MYNLSEQLLKQYTFEVTDIQKGRGAYICVTDAGKILLKEFKGSEVRAETIRSILNQLREGGIATDMILPCEGESILAIDMDGTKYYARRYLEGRECEPKSREDILRASRMLAHLHMELDRCEIEVPECMQADEGELIREYEKHNRELKKIYNYIRQKKKKNELEVLFMDNFADFYAQAVETTKQLAEQMRRLNEEQRAGMRGWCHGEYSQHNVLFTREGLTVTNFEQMMYDIRMKDFAHFLRKIMEKYNWNTGLAVDMTAAYEKRRKLAPEELMQLYIRLSYPEKFWKVANHYYNSNKAWMPVRDMEKLERLIMQEEQRKQFLKMLFNFIGE